MGYSEAAYAMPEALTSSSSELLRYLARQPKLDALCSEVETGKSSLCNVYEKAVSAGLAQISGLDSLPESEYNMQKYARPPGYCTQTILHLGQMAVLSLLHYGATCSGMPEEVALAVITHALEAVEKTI